MFSNVFYSWGQRFFYIYGVCKWVEKALVGVGRLVEKAFVIVGR